MRGSVSIGGPLAPKRVHEHRLQVDGFVTGATDNENSRKAASGRNNLDRPVLKGSFECKPVRLMVV